jgi:signal peptidase II
MNITIVYILIVAFGVGLDQAIKYLVETGLDMHTMVDVLPFLALYRTHNTGIAFSLLSGMGSVGLVALTLAVLGLVTWLAIKAAADQIFARIGFALIIAGAVGNLIDRIWLGYVVDYVLFHLPGWSFAIFNLADAFITVGAAMVVLDEIAAWRRERRERRS